jgi:hypothetical protein
VKIELVLYLNCAAYPDSKKSLRKIIFVIMKILNAYEFVFRPYKLLMDSYKMIFI